MRLRFLMELVLALAVGFGMGRVIVSDRMILYGQEGFDLIYRYQIVFNTTAAGVGLVIGLGTWVEAARTSSPRAWGPGRWIWSVSAAYLVLEGVKALRWFAIPLRHSGLSWSSVYPAMRDHLEILGSVQFGSTFAILLASAAISARVARASLGPRADDREWAGRVFGVLILLSALTEFAADVWYSSSR